MLDNFLGNVFGRSKKQTNSSGATTAAPNTAGTGSPDSGNDFVVLPSDDRQTALYPPLLTQEMIVGHNVGAGHSSSSMAATHAQRSSAQTYSSPIDNIPFTSLTIGGQELCDSNTRSLVRSFETIDRIQQYLSTASQSEYSFHLENNILSESLLQS